MRRVKLIGVAIFAVVALSAVVSASASAAAPEFKPASGSFTSTSGAGTLQIKGGNTIECEKDKDTGTITGAKSTTFTVDFEGCKLFGIFGAHSKGDPEGTILLSGTDELCKISGTKIGDALTLSETVKIEAVGKTSEVEGTVIGEVTPTGSKSLTGKLILEQSGGAQKITKCEGETGTLILLANEEAGGAKKEAGEATTDTITYETEEEVTN